MGLGKLTEDATVIPRATLGQMTVQFAVESVSSLPWNECPVCVEYTPVAEVAGRAERRRLIWVIWLQLQLPMIAGALMLAPGFVSKEPRAKIERGVGP